MDYSGFIGILVGFLVVLIIIFLVCREFIMWYYKINERLAEQKKTNELLRQLIYLESQGNRLNAYGVVTGNNTGETDKTREIYGDIPDL